MVGTIGGFRVFSYGVDLASDRLAQVEASLAKDMSTVFRR